MRGLRDPLEGIRVICAHARGLFYSIYYRYVAKNVTILLPFKAFASIHIVGPGSVHISKNCAIVENVFRGLTVVTLSESSKVTIGEGSVLGGLTIRCKNEIQIGRGTLSAYSLVQDVNFVESHKINRESFDELQSKPILIGDNCWLAGMSVVLGGSVIGNDCVIAAGSCCHSRKYGDHVLIGGNPTGRAFPIARMLDLKRQF